MRVKKYRMPEQKNKIYGYFLDRFVDHVRLIKYKINSERLIMKSHITIKHIKQK